MQPEYIGVMVDVTKDLPNILDQLDFCGTPYHFIRKGEPYTKTAELGLSVDGHDTKLEIYLKPDGTFIAQAPFKLSGLWDADREVSQ